MEKSRAVAFGAIAMLSVLLVASAWGLYTTLVIPQTGKVSTLTAYWDSSGTDKVVSVSWGESLAPDSTQTKTIWVKNSGGSAVNLTMLTGNWNPAAAPEYMKITWDREDYTLAADFIIECTLTLTVYANATEFSVGSFSCDVVVTGEW